MERVESRSRVVGAWLALLLLPMAAVGQVVVLPDAFYRADLTYPAPAQHLVGPGGLGVDAPLRSGAGVDLGHLTASAATGAGLLPTAGISIDLTGNGYAAVAGEAYAGLNYNWRVEQIGGVERSTARVKIHVLGSVSSATEADADISPLYAQASIDFIGSQSIFVAGLNPGRPYVGDAFDVTFTKVVGKDSIFSASLVAYGLAGASWHGGDGRARGDAFVDPLIEIDPDWAYAGDFRVVFSSGIGPPPIPEPATGILLALGLAGMAARTCQQRAKGRAP